MQKTNILKTEGNYFERLRGVDYYQNIKYRDLCACRCWQNNRY